jgi:hypothetical protein
VFSWMKMVRTQKGGSNHRSTEWTIRIRYWVLEISILLLGEQPIICLKPSNRLEIVIVENKQVKFRLLYYNKRMSEYFDNKQLFSSPKVSQYGNHMVMTNVVKNTRVKYINIDTKYCDEYIKPYPGIVDTQTTSCQCPKKDAETTCNCHYLERRNYQTSINIPSSYKTFSYTFTLPEKINDVKSISVMNMEIPILFHNISASQGNNYFVISSDTESKVITIPDGQYNPSNLVDAINAALNSSDGVNGNNLICVLDTTTNTVIFVAREENSAYIYFAVNSSGEQDKYNTKSKLGWLLGFRNIRYFVLPNPDGIRAETSINVSGRKYLYLSVDDFSKGSENSFISFSSNSQLPNKALAKISMDRNLYPYGTIQVATRTMGSLVSDRRTYNGKVDIQKLVVKLIDENGATVNLNGADFSFCLKVEYE